MSLLDQIGVLVLTYNEAPNIGRTLEALRAFPEVVVLDSGSTDCTASIVAGFHNTRLETRAFDSHGAQWSHGLERCGLTRPWVLALDADYVLPATLVEEISRLAPNESVAGYRASFRYCIHGRPLSGALYTPVVVLYRRARARYVQTGHTQRVMVEGTIVDLGTRIDHDDRKPLGRWFAAQQRYARLEAEHLIATPRGELRRIDRLRLAGWVAPILVFLYALLWKRCLFDGWPGWFYVLQRTLAEAMIALEVLEHRFVANNQCAASTRASTPLHDSPRAMEASAALRPGDNQKSDERST